MESDYFGSAGLCTNESCPYRHVNVNKEAPICEAFRQGYCADGDKVRHTFSNTGYYSTMTVKWYTTI